MHRIEGIGATAQKTFTEGNPQTGVEPTQVTDDWLNAVQEEIAGVIEAAGLTLEDAGTDTHDQLLAAIGGALAPVSVRRFGAKGDGVTDDTSAIQQAIDSVAAKGGTVIFPAGVYLTKDTLSINNDGITLVGMGAAGLSSDIAGSDGVVGHGQPMGATRIVADFTAGAAVRIYANNCGITGIVVDASNVRKAAARSANHGIHVEAADQASKSTKRLLLHRVRVTNQPADGIYLVNDVVCSRLDMVDVDNVNGHGISVVGGSATGRTNRSRPGQVQIDNCRVSRTGGHSLRVGGGDAEVDIDDMPYRIEVHNFEAFYNCITPSICVDPANVSNGYLSGENNLVVSSAFDGRSEFPSVDSTHTTLEIRGRHVDVINYRAIHGAPYAIRITGHPSLSSISSSINISNIYVLNNYKGAGFYNPAVWFNSNARDVRVSTHVSSSSITQLSSRAGVAYREYYNGVETSNTAFSYENISAGLVRADGFRSSASEYQLNNGQAGYIQFSSACRGMLHLSSTTSAGRAAVVHFRLGDANAHATVMAAAGGTVTGVVGTLSGSTGASGDLTVSADSATNRIYIENRTGAARSYSYSFSPMQGASTPLTASPFTTV